jgi:hypothetical protein
MKKVLLFLVQFALFLVTFVVGSFLTPLHIRQALSVTKEGTRFFVWDGLVLMALLFVLILLIEQARRRLASAGPWTASAFILAAAAGFALKLGFLTV